MAALHPPSRLSRGGGFCVCYSWRQKAKGKTVFFSVCASIPCWLPGASQIAGTTVIGTQPARCCRGFPRASSLQVSLQGGEAMPPSTPGELALWKRHGMKEGRCCLATPRGVPSCPPMGLWNSGSGQASHSSPRAWGQLRVVPRTSVFCIRLDTQDGMQFLRSEPQQVLQVTHEAVHVALA